MLEFLAELFESVFGYSAINTARSALSTIVNINNVPVGQHPLVKRFMRGIFNERPVLPQYNVTQLQSNVI